MGSSMTVREALDASTLVESALIDAAVARPVFQAIVDLGAEGVAFRVGVSPTGDAMINRIGVTRIDDEDYNLGRFQEGYEDGYEDGQADAYENMRDDDDGDIEVPGDDEPLRFSELSVGALVKVVGTPDEHIHVLGRIGVVSHSTMTREPRLEWLSMVPSGTVFLSPGYKPEAANLLTLEVLGWA